MTSVYARLVGWLKLRRPEILVNEEVQDLAEELHELQQKSEDHEQRLEQVDRRLSTVETRVGVQDPDWWQHGRVG